MISELKRTGMTASVLNWFKSLTRLCGELSPPLNIDIDVQQGTPLSCPMFIVMNDIAKLVQQCQLNLFDDDDALLWVSADTV